MEGILHMSEILRISQRRFTSRRDSSHVRVSSHIPETFHISQGFFTYGRDFSHVRDTSRITGMSTSPFQYHWPQPAFQWVPGKGVQSLKRNIQLHIAPRSTMRIIVLSHSDLVLWQGNYCLSCALLSIRRRCLHTFLTLALNVCEWPASSPGCFTPKERSPMHIRQKAECAPQPTLPVPTAVQ